MRFVDKLRQAAHPIWAAIFAHPLLRQLCDGSLPIATFQYFLVHLPCPWTYHEIGQRLGAVAHPLYAEWAAFYTSGGLAESVGAWTELVELTAATAGPANGTRCARPS